MLDEETKASVIELATAYAAIVSRQNGSARSAFAAFRKAFPSYTEETETLFASTLLREVTKCRDATTKPQLRRIVQISHSSAVDVTDRYATTGALCDDGTVWWIEGGGEWIRRPDIPQDEEETTK
jgi:hypothetical protein